MDELILMLDDPTSTGNQVATPEYALNIGEKVDKTVNDFAAAFVKFLNGDSQVDAINFSTNLSSVADHFLGDAKGITADRDELAEELISKAKDLAGSLKTSFLKLESKNLKQVDGPRRVESVTAAQKDMQGQLHVVMKCVETFVPKEVQGLNGDDIGDIVEREMSNAARAIQDALSRLDALMKAPKAPQVTMTEKSVHDAILEST